MSGNARGNWVRFRFGRGCGVRGRRAAAALLPLHRPLRFEALEDRRLLANVTVGNLLDVVNGNTTSIANLIAGDGGDGISLREAILAAEATTGADEITFAEALSGQTITLGGTELAITEALAIDARPLAANVTIDANELSRIFNFTSTTGDFTLGGLTLTGGKTIGNNPVFNSTFSGGAIRSLTSGNFTLDQCTVSGNRTEGLSAKGGGIFSKSVTLAQSTVSGNSTAGDFGYGGGIFSFGSVTLTQSTVSGNSTEGSFARAGGIHAGGDVTLTQSTVTDNHALSTTSAVGGVIQFNENPVALLFSISGSIVAGNTAGGGGSDLAHGPQSTLTVISSLIGDNANTLLTEAQTPDVNGNLIGNAAGAGIINPMLDMLADNGGPTQTHALLAGSPAIDKGDPSFDPNDFDPPLVYDQRGPDFDRVINGRIDMGAFELQPIGPALPGDYNQDHSVDAADYVLWRKTSGTTGVPAYSGADGDGDTMIGDGDYDVWTANFGEALVGSGGSGELRVESGELRVEVLSQASSVSSGEMAVGAQRIMPVSERLAHVAESLRDSDGRQSARQVSQGALTLALSHREREFQSG